MLPREYQVDCLNIIKSKPHGKYLIVMGTGLGKSFTFSRISFKKHMLILSHREELVNQPRKYFDCTYGVEMGKYTSNGEKVISACVPSLIKRLEKFPRDYFDVIITDECFPSGTIIDNKSIENIHCDDIITSYNHMTNEIEYKKVINIFKSIPKSIVIVKLNNKEIICTGNHPIYTKKGYKPAINLNENDEVFYMSARNNKSNSITKRNMVQNKTSTNVLFKRMFKRILQKNKFRNNDKNQQKICIRKNEKKQPNEKFRITTKNVKKIKRNWALSKNKMWKWCRFNSSTTKFINSLKKLRTICRIPINNKYEKKFRVPTTLQNRHSNNKLYDCNRNRRVVSFCNDKKRTRQEKRRFFKWIRVESVKIQKQTSDGTFGGLCKDGYVYNLEIEDNNNYFVNNVLVHNCHHSPCASYQKIYEYFQYDYHFGLTATPNRSDNVRLNNIFDEIIFNRDLKWGIQNKYLSDIYAMRFYMDYDLSRVKTSNGDYQINQLEKAVNTTENAAAIAEIYNKHAMGSTLIFGVSVAHCEEIAKQIKNSVIITAKTKNRSEIIDKFTSGEIKCLVNCQIFTEGTDIPRVNTLIIARPTKNISLYTQMVGRGLRLYPGKENLRLIDCCGVSGLNLCMAPSLLGCEMYDLGNKKTPGRDELIEGDLFDLPEKIKEAENTPDYWKINYKIVDLWAKGQGYNTHNINFRKLSNGDLTLELPNIEFTINAPDELGQTWYHGKKLPMQQVLDYCYTYLLSKQQEATALWDLSICKKWGKHPITQKQKNIIKRFLPNYDLNMTSLEASQIITKLLGRKKKK